MVGQRLPLSGHESEQTPGDSEGAGKPGMLQSMESQRVGATEQQKQILSEGN